MGVDRDGDADLRERQRPVGIAIQIGDDELGGDGLLGESDARIRGGNDGVRLAYKRTNHGNLHVRGYKEEGTTTTPFDMTVLNDIDRFHLASDVLERVPEVGPRAAYIRQGIRDKLVEHRQYIEAHGQDMPEVRNWRWGAYQRHELG